MQYLKNYIKDLSYTCSQRTWPCPCTGETQQPEEQDHRRCVPHCRRGREYNPQQASAGRVSLLSVSEFSGELPTPTILTASTGVLKMQQDFIDGRQCGLRVLGYVISEWMSSI